MLVGIASVPQFAVASPMRQGIRLPSLDKAAVWIVLAALLLLAGLASDAFFKLNYLTNLARQAAPVGITAVGAGQPVAFASPADVRKAGVANVYQEFSSIPELTVADNIFLGREFKERFGAVDRNAASRAAAALLDR